MTSINIMLLGISLMLFGGMLNADNSTNFFGYFFIFPGLMICVLGFIVGFVKKD